MYGINTKNGRTIRGMWLTLNDAERDAHKESNRSLLDVYYVTDENQQRVAAFQNGTDVSRREGIACEAAEKFCVVSENGSIYDATVMRRGTTRVVTIVGERREFGSARSKRSCVASAAGDAGIDVSEILADGEPTRAELIASTGGVR